MEESTATDLAYGLARLASRRRSGRLWVWNRAAGTSYEIRVEDRESLRSASERRATRAWAKNRDNYASRQVRP